MSELKPCPFCGGENLFVGNWAQIQGLPENHPNYSAYSKSYGVVCSYIFGGCGATGGAARSIEEAIEAWNRRDVQ